VQQAQGDLAGALKSYRDALAIVERLAKSDPSNASLQSDLGTAYANLASAFRKGSDNAKALVALRQGRTIIERLTKLSPDNAVWKHSLAWYNGQITELARQR
jgi:tetratricopeptide (TPR) repeat protein